MRPRKDLSSYFFLKFFLIFMGTILATNHCAFAEVFVNEVNRIKQVSTLAFMNPEVTVSVLDGNNNAKLLPNETSLMFRTIQNELEYNLNKKGYNFRIKTGERDKEVETNEIPLRVFLNEYINGKNKNKREATAPINDYLKKYYESDAVIFVQSHSSYYDADATTSSNVVAGASTVAALTLLRMPVAAFNSNNGGGIIIVIIDPKTGGIIWHGQAGAIDWDFRSSGRMTKMLEEMFRDFPESEHKVIQPAFMKKRSEILKEQAITLGAQ